MPKLITAQFKFPDATPVSFGTLSLKLSQDTVVQFFNYVAPKNVQITLDINGQIPGGGSLIYGNDELIPAGTVYIMSVSDAGGGLVYGPELISIVGVSPINLNSIVPTNIGGIVISYPAPILSNPNSPQTIFSQPLTIQAALNVSAISSNNTPATGGFLNLGVGDKININDGANNNLTVLTVSGGKIVLAGFTMNAGAINSPQSLVLTSADGVSGDGNAVTVLAGNGGATSPPHNGGSVSILGGNGSTGSSNGGNVVLQPGTGNSANGSVVVNSGVAKDGSGLKHANITTGSITNGTRAEVTITWTTPFADNNYDVVVSVQDSTTGGTSQGLVLERIRTKSASAISAVVSNPTGGSLTGTLFAIAIHN